MNGRLTYLTTAIALFFVCLVPRNAAGQVESSTDIRSLVPSESFPDRRTFITAGSILVGTVLLIETDEALRGWFQSSDLQESPFLSDLANGVEPIGRHPAFATAGMFLLGTVLGEPTLEDIGLHASEGILATSVITQAMKWAFGRPRPRTSGGEAEFFFRAGSESRPGSYQSFPSGHTSTAFALAAALSEEVGHRWPDRARWVSIGSYSAAGMVGLSRIYHDKHWGSDVAIGALVGTTVSKLIIRRAHSDEALGPSRLERYLIPNPSGGLSFGARLRF